VRVEGDLDADDAREHPHRGAPEHRPRGGARVVPHGERRPDQHRQHEQSAETLDGHGHGGREQHEQDEPQQGGAQAGRRGAAGVEGHRRERAVQGHEGGAAEHEEARGCGKVAVGDPERIAEEQLLQPLRRVRRQREQRAEPDQAGDRHGGAGVRADARVARGERDQRGGHQRPAGGAEQERSAGERREHQPWEEAVRERLRAVGKALGHDPEAERATEASHQGELEQRTPVDAGAQRVDEEVDHLHVSARARGAGL